MDAEVVPSGIETLRSVAAANELRELKRMG